MKIKKFQEFVKLFEGSISDIKRSAREYPGSYSLGLTGRKKINGIVVSYIAYTNPNNVTSNGYISYTYGNKEGNITVKNLDIYSKKDIESAIEHDMS